MEDNINKEKECMKKQSDLSDLEDGAKEMVEKSIKTEKNLSDLLCIVYRKKKDESGEVDSKPDKGQPDNRIIAILNDLSVTKQKLGDMNVVISELRNIIGE